MFSVNINKQYWWAAIGILFVVYSILAFAIPFPKNSVFAISYLFSVLAIGAQLYVIHISFYRGNHIKSKFYGFPIARIGVLYLIIQLIASFIFMAMGSIIPAWLPLVIYVLLAGASAIGLIAADVVRNDVMRQENKQVKQTSRMYEFQSLGQMLMNMNKMSSADLLLKKLAEDLRFSDPVSNDSLTNIEDQLASCLSQLQEAVSTQDMNQIMYLCEEADQLLAKRNLLCKMTK